ncbi:flagellin [Frigoribacterium sp. Leaf263]|uniref:flagellin N-terminal helical domain-containing protein n=1 Tax=Frigoribacterium sp. Leaf263 TaxID=1736313 RepID=UPI00070185F5|nr:flagellin [Frigoribacterium sp. Leaf263]KQO81728.1 flagellin [Frigoribacterium sp. Leaf263]
MGMQINTNLAANNTYRNLNATQNDLSKSLEKLSSGLRINRAADDAAGLSISEGLRSQVGGLTVAARNAQDGISVVQTAEGGLTETHSILQRMRDLAVQAGNDSNNADSRKAITTEVDALQKELSRISASTNFNGTNLLDGSKSSLKFQVGANSGSDSQITVDLSKANVSAIATNISGGDLATAGTKFAIDDLTALGTTASFTSSKDGVSTTVTTATLSSTADGSATGFQSVDEFATALKSDAAFSANFSVSVDKDANGAGVGITVTALNGGTLADGDNDDAGDGLGAGAAATALTGGVQFDTAEKAQASIKLIDEQIKTVSTARSELGAVQNRFEHAINVTNVAKENLTAAESRIRDTDMAEEMVKYTRSNILSQAGTAMLAQANQSTQGVLSLLR